MPKKESYQKGMTKKEIYSKLKELKTEEGKAEYLYKILSKKGLLAPETYKAVQGSADEIYKGMAMEAILVRNLIPKGDSKDIEYFAKKIKNKKLADEIYRKAAVGATEEGLFVSAGEYAEKIKNKKLADEIYGKMALEAVERENFYHAIEFTEKIKNKKLAAKIRKSGEVIKAKDLRKRLERESKKK